MLHPSGSFLMGNRFQLPLRQQELLNDDIHIGYQMKALKSLCILISIYFLTGKLLFRELFPINPHIKSKYQQYSPQK